MKPFTKTSQATHPVLLIMTGCLYDGKGRDVYREVYKKRCRNQETLKTLEYESWMGSHQRTTRRLQIDPNAVSRVPFDGTHYDQYPRPTIRGIKCVSLDNFIPTLVTKPTAREGNPCHRQTPTVFTTFDMDIGSQQENWAQRVKNLSTLTLNQNHSFPISKDTNNRVELVDGRSSFC